MVINNNIVTTDPVSGIGSTTFNEKRIRLNNSSHTHIKLHTDNAGNDKILNRTNHNTRRKEKKKKEEKRNLIKKAIINTSTYTNKPSGH
jgi:hypothetical protein